MIRASNFLTILTNKDRCRLWFLGRGIWPYHAPGKENKALRGGMPPLHGQTNDYIHWEAVPSLRQTSAQVKVIGNRGSVPLHLTLNRPREEDTMMAILVRGKSCPRCRNIERHRLRRSFWMRLLPGSRYYLCENCEVKFVSLFDLFSLHWPFGSVAWDAQPHPDHQPSPPMSFSNGNPPTLPWIYRHCFAGCFVFHLLCLSQHFSISRNISKAEWVRCKTTSIWAAHLHESLPWEGPTWRCGASLTRALPIKWCDYDRCGLASPWPLSQKYFWGNSRETFWLYCQIYFQEAYVQGEIVVHPATPTPTLDWREK